MSSIREQLLTKGFGRPEGLFGQFGGWLMARSNGPTEKHLVKVAQLHPKDRVLVLGPGPGVGLRAAGKHAALVVGVDPSDTMLLAAKHRCADLVEAGRVQLVRGDAQDTHQPDASASVVLSVNNVQLWPDRPAAFAEIHRVMKPNGRLFISVHEKWQHDGRTTLTTELDHAGFAGVESWTWEPPGRGAGTALMLSCRRSPS